MPGELPGADGGVPAGRARRAAMARASAVGMAGRGRTSA